MLIVGGVWLLGISGWVIWSGYSQLREIRMFADKGPNPVSPAQPAGEQIAALRARVMEFGSAVGRKEKTSLRLTVEDLNTLLATEEAAKGLRESAKVEDISDTVRLRVSTALNGVPFSGELLYLNGMVEVSPTVEKDAGLKLRTVSISVPSRSVPEGFVRLCKERDYPGSLLLDPVRDSSVPGATEVLKAITNARLEPGAAVLEYLPGQ